jgi:Na+-transporting methylmalonyl-CoA/oxaloacetate decarboxylase gamma subunit
MKKIYDILPPGLAEKKELRQEPVRKEKKKIKIPFKWTGFVVLVLLLAAFFVEGRSEVTIYPKTEEVSGEETVTLKQGVLDEENKIVPVIVFSNDSDESQSYSATGRTDKDKKAKAVIRVFNKHKPEKSLTLIKGTRFLSVPGELIYRATAGFTVPQAKTVDGKFTPGYVDVEVEADQAGESYNLSSATFSVPGLSGTEYYSSIWAETINPITGGFKSEVSVVLQKDIDNAKAAFEEEFLAKGKEELKNSMPANYRFFEEDFVSEIIGLTVSAKTGEEVASFTVSGKVKTETEVFRKEDLEALLAKSVESIASEGKKTVPGSLSYEIIEKKSKGDDGTELKVSFKAKAYWLPEDDFLLQNITGKNKSYAISLLEALPEVDRAEIKLSPFWKISNPNNKDRVEIKLGF